MNISGPLWPPLSENFVGNFVEFWSAQPTHCSTDSEGQAGFSIDKVSDKVSDKGADPVQDVGHSPYVFKRFESRSALNLNSPIGAAKSKHLKR